MPIATLHTSSDKYSANTDNAKHIANRNHKSQVQSLT